MTDISQASGNLGPHIIKALVDANFQVTVLTRSKQTDEYDASIKVLEVDFTSVESLTAALKGVDGLVSAVASSVIESQTVLIDAAVAAGVKRFIPSEYGSVTTDPKLETLPIYASMFNIRRYLQEKAKTEKLTWSVLACGAFTEFMFKSPFVLDLVNHKVKLFDEGDNRMSTTSLPNVGRAIAGIFNNAKATENRIVRVSEIIITQNGLLKIVEELRPDIKWEKSKVPASAVLKEGLDGLKGGDFTFPVIMKVLMGTALAGELYGSAYDETDNKLLGIKELTDEDLKKVVAEELARIG